MSYFLSSQIFMHVSSLLRLFNEDDKLFFIVQWKGLTKYDYLTDPIARAYDDFPQSVCKLLDRKSSPLDLREKAQSHLGL